MHKPEKILNVDTLIDNKTATTEIRAKLRANLPNIYLSEENLAKLESFGFSRSEILMAHTPNDFFSMSSVEVLRSFGFVPRFNKDIALKLMSKDYIVNNYSELAKLGADIDLSYIFSGVSKEVGEYYAEKLAASDSMIDCGRLLVRLNYRAVFFLTNTLLLYGVDPTRILKKLDPNEIKTHRDTFIRYGLKDTEIDERINYCLKAQKGEAISYNGRNGHEYMSVPIKNIKCLNCKNNHVYHGFQTKHFCCDRCRQLYILKREARREIAKEMEMKKNASKN